MSGKQLRNAFAGYLTPKYPGRELENARELPRELIEPNPWQPRRHADPDRLRELADDIRVRGILQPLLVRPLDNGRFQIVAGERRYQAAGLAELTDLPCIVMDGLNDDEMHTIALVENLQREELDVEDEARALKELHDAGLSLRDIGALIHKSYKYVQRRLRLIEDPAALEAYRAGQLNLEDLVSDRSVSLIDVPMADLVQAAQAAADELLQADEVVTQRHNDADRAASAQRIGSRKRRQSIVYKPYQRLLLHVRRTQPDEVPAAERDAFRQTVTDLIDELNSLVRSLDDAR